MGYRVVIRSPGTDVEAWSSVRLPFEPKGWLVEFRRDLAAACRTLVSGPGQLLYATYTADDPALVDVENVLTYNLGTGAISAAARHGLLLERRFDAPPPSPDEGPTGGHHYRYRVVDSGGWSCWTAGEPLASFELVAPAALFNAPKAGRWWRAARRALRAGAAPATHRVTLTVRVSPPEGWRGSLVGLVKPMADGLIAAAHAHNGPLDDALLDRAAAIDPALSPHEFRELLTAPGPAPLGPVRLVVARAAGVMWLPADDRIVAMDVQLGEREPGTVEATISAAQPVS